MGIRRGIKRGLRMGIERGIRRGLGMDIKMIHHSKKAITALIRHSPACCASPWLCVFYVAPL